MEARINNNAIGGISKAVYIPNSAGSNITCYNAGKAGINYRFLEYGVSYLATDPSDFNILENMTLGKITEFFGTTIPNYDALENLYNTAVPCEIGEETNPQYNNYFGSFVANQKTVYVFLVPEGISKIKMYQDVRGEDTEELPEGDLTVNFDRPIEISEAKVVYISINQVGNGENNEVQVGWKSWMQLLNPNRHKPKSLISLEDTRIKVPRIEKRGCAWYDAASGTILGNTEIPETRGKLLKNKKQSLLPQGWSGWKSYREGEKVLYPEGRRINLGGEDLDYIETLPKGEVCIYGACNISDILLLDTGNNSTRSLWFNGASSLTQKEGNQEYVYYLSSASSLIYRSKKEEDEISINPVQLAGADREYRCLKFTLSEDSQVKIVARPGNWLDGGCLIIETTRTWVSLKDNNMGNPPSSLSIWWSTKESLTDYYTQITELYCPGGDIVPSGLINVKSGTTEIGARLKLKPGWKAGANQYPGVEVTQRLETLDEGTNTYFHVSVNKEYDQYWKRKYIIAVDPESPNITFQFPILYTNSTSGMGYSERVNISEFYRRKNPDNINYGVTIDIKEEIKNRSLNYDSDIPIDEFLRMQEFDITPDFPGMIISDSSVADIEEVTIYKGQFKFVPANRMLSVLMANSYDFSVSNPYDSVEYGSIVDGLSFRSETGAVPGWIWINKAMIEVEEDEFEPLKIPLTGLVNDIEESVIIDGLNYGFTKMIITKSGREYKIKIEDIRNSIKIDIMEA